jgi:hypothetical protein
MMGMEKMLASMLGLTPEQMHSKAKEFEKFVSGGSQALIAIAETQQKILDRLDAMEAAPNGKRK